jgi:hypothetical protein
MVDRRAGRVILFLCRAPIIGRCHDLSLLDADAALLDDAFGRTAAWARRQGFAATASGDELLVSTPRGLWRMQASQRMLDAGDVHQGADAVVCSALLDLVSAAWLARLCDTLTVPFLACLAVDGRQAWRPRHPYDALVRSAFRHDMRRNKGFGPALGMAAPSITLRILSERGFTTASAPSDWRIPRTALGMQRALIDGAADAARPAHPTAVTTWQEARLRQALRGRLAITIGHRDILGLPPGG